MGTFRFGPALLLTLLLAAPPAAAGPVDDLVDQVRDATLPTVTDCVQIWDGCDVLPLCNRVLGEAECTKLIGIFGWEIVCFSLQGGLQLNLDGSESGCKPVDHAVESILQQAHLPPLPP